MALQLYIMRLRCLSRNYDTLFWSFVFPLLLAVFFYLGFGNLTNGADINSIPVTVVKDKNEDSIFMEAIRAARMSNGKLLFSVQEKSLDRAKTMLLNGDIDGYIVESGTPVLYITQNGINQSIMKAFIDNYLHVRSTVQNVMDINQSVLNEEFVNSILEQTNYLNDRSAGDKNPDYVLIYFYSLIALTCMFGTSWGFKEMSDIQADQSPVGARLNAAPVHKMKLLVCNLLAAFTLHYISILFLLLFLNKVLDVDLGDRLDMVLLISFMGSLCGITLGAMVCVAVKVNEKLRAAILNVIVIGGGFLSGMVITDLKYIIAEKAPIISYINPSSLITDAFYSLYYYNSYQRLFLNLFILGIITLVSGAVTYHEIRRKEYASI